MNAFYNNDKTCRLMCINSSEIFMHHTRRDVFGPDGQT